jgi:hypothetical protein
MPTLIFWLLMTTVVHAANLEWDNTADGLLDVEFRVTVNEPWIVLKTIPAYPSNFPLTQFGYYRLKIPGTTVYSNEARYFMDVVGSDNLSVKALDADRIEIVGMNCKSLSTTGRGLKRIVRCVR